MDEILKREENNILNLRQLYGHYGYVHYKMNKFEEYDLYVANKDFLVHNDIITFTDTDGKLLALKPDVTLSIVKNYKDVPGTVQKVYYNENIYRTSRNTKAYKEIMQMGLECMGDLDLYQISEVLMLAAKSLELLGGHYILDLSHMGVLRGLLEALDLDPGSEKQLFSFLREKNCHGIREMGCKLGLSDPLTEKITALASSYGPISGMLEILRSVCMNETMEQAAKELECISGLLAFQGISDIHLDFSIVNDMSYYNGVLFQGYIAGIPSCVLSGGQYDILMKKMGKSAGAAGFAVNLDLLEKLDPIQEHFDVDLLLLYDSSCPPERLIQAVNTFVKEGKRVQVQRQIPEKLRYRRLIKVTEGGWMELEGDH